MFVDPQFSVKELESRFQRQLRERWLHSLRVVGGDATWERGLTVKVAYKEVWEYVAKYGIEPQDDLGWNISHEVTKAPVKQARKGGLTPFGLLQDAGAGSVLAADLFREYVAAFYRVHQLEWSKNLRAYMGLKPDEQPENEIAESVPDNAVLLCALSREQWSHILRADLRGELLDRSRDGDVEKLWQWLLSVGVDFETSVNLEKLMWERVNARGLT